MAFGNVAGLVAFDCQPGDRCFLFGDSLGVERATFVQAFDRVGVFAVNMLKLGASRGKSIDLVFEVADPKVGILVDAGRRGADKPRRETATGFGSGVSVASVAVCP